MTHGSVRREANKSRALLLTGLSTLLREWLTATTQGVMARFRLVVMSAMNQLY